MSMILRSSDWGYHPGSVYDLNTENESFIKLAYTHKLLGVKNWYMVLALYRPELSGLFVRHDYTGESPSTLTVEQKALSNLESSENVWYWFREVAYVPQEGDDPTIFLINRGTFSLIWSYFNNVDIALLMIRQQGKSVVLYMLMLYLSTYARNLTMILITKDGGLRAETMVRMRRARDAMPRWTYVLDGDSENEYMFTYNKRNNKVLTVIPPTDKKAANNRGRGNTAGTFGADEIALTRYIELMLPAALAAGTKVRLNMAKAGLPHGNMFVTTPGMLNTPEGAFTYQMFTGGVYWDESMLNLPNKDALHNHINVSAPGDRTLIHAPFTHRQLGMSDIELYNAIRNAGGDRLAKLRDFGLQWTSGNADSPFTTEQLESIKASLKRPTYNEIFKNNYTLKWFYDQDMLDRNMQTMHVIGLDTSDAVGRDAIVLTFVNSETLELAAIASIKESNLYLFAMWLFEVMVKYPNTILIPERKSSAPTIIDTLTVAMVNAGINPCKRIFNRVTQDYDKHDAHYKDYTYNVSQYKDPRFMSKYRATFGFMTTSTTRSNLYGDVLTYGIELASNVLYAAELINELLGLVVKNNRVDHPDGGHDDTVISWMMAIWFILYGKNLDFYGLSNRRALRRIANNVEETEEDHEELIELIDEVRALISELNRTKCPYGRLTLERKIRNLLRNIQLDTHSARSLSELEELLSAEKLKRGYS